MTSGSRRSEAQPHAGLVEERAAHWLVIALAGYLVLMAVLVLGVDAANLFGSRDALVASPLERPALWWYFNGEGYVTELLQWSVLGALALVSAATAADMHRAGHAAPTRYWTTMAVLAVLLLIEDAGNPRHRLAGFLVMLTEDYLFRFLAEILLFFVLGAVALYAVVVHGVVLRRSSVTLRLTAAGILLYATAGITSALRRVGGWYDAIGRVIRETLGLRVVEYTEGTASEIAAASDYALVDMLVEEPIELIAATLLLLAALRYRVEAARDPVVAVVGDGLWNRRTLLRR